MHHISWLGAFKDALKNPRSISETERRRIAATCEQVLRQNPESALAQDILKKIQTALAARSEQTNTSRPDAIDLVTGKKIVNIRLIPVSNDQGNYVYQGLLSSSERAAQGEIVNVRNFVESCDQYGPFPGFLQIFTPEEIANLERADAVLAERCFRQFARLLIGERTEEVIEAMDRALDRHIAPLVERIPTTETQQSIREALSLWEVNLQNPSRNIFYRSEKAGSPGENIGQEYALPLYRKNPQYFSVGIMHEGNAPDNVSVGYDATRRTVLLRRENEYNFLQALGALHELTHVVQHNRFLRHHDKGDPSNLAATHQTWVRHMLENPGKIAHGVLEHECEAWANVIEVLIARTGFGKFQIPDMLRTLGIDPENTTSRRELYEIGLFASEYYRGGKRAGDQFPPQYMKAIEDFYRSLGIDLILAKDLQPSG